MRIRQPVECFKGLLVIVEEHADDMVISTEELEEK